MKIELNTEQEVGAYVRYLYDKEMLVDKLGAVTLEGSDAESFIVHKVSSDDDQAAATGSATLAAEIIESQTETASSTDTGKIVSKHWSTKEDLTLLCHIRGGLSPAEIAEAMNRKEAGVKSRALRKYGKGYKKKTWWNAKIKPTKVVSK